MPSPPIPSGVLHQGSLKQLIIKERSENSLSNKGAHVWMLTGSRKGHEELKNVRVGPLDLYGFWTGSGCSDRIRIPLSEKSTPGSDQNTRFRSYQHHIVVLLYLGILCNLLTQDILRAHKGKNRFVTALVL